jgi:hypothetical protein
MQVWEIYNAIEPWHGCADMRPWLVVEVRPFGLYGCFPFSSECYGGSCFEISHSHPDFAATGLTKSCFIQDSHIIELSSQRFSRRRGALTGRLLADFRAFSGL